MASRAAERLKLLTPSRIILPILIGLAVASYMVFSALQEERFEKKIAANANYVWVDGNENGAEDKEEFVFKGEGQGEYVKITYRDELRSINWSWYSTLWIVIAIISMFIRDLSYMYRIRVLTDNHISWRRSFDVIMLWEFASAVAPSAVGGSTVAMFIVNREGIKLGKSTAIVLITSLLDQIFYIVMVPLVLLVVGTQRLLPDFSSRGMQDLAAAGINLFFIAFALMCLYAVIISWAIFVRPRGFKWLLIKIFSLPFLRKWRPAAAETGNEIIDASKEIRGKPFSYWFKATAATFASWTARFWVTNFIIMAFFPVSEHMLIYARQLVMWVIMHVTPTPGGSGVAEIIFTGFIGEFILSAGLIGSIAIIWRLISYYPYLFIGAVILPGWIKRSYIKKKA